jgi:hypothetical protein
MTRRCHFKTKSFAGVCNAFWVARQLWACALSLEGVQAQERFA